MNGTNVLSKHVGLGKTLTIVVEDIFVNIYSYLFWVIELRIYSCTIFVFQWEENEEQMEVICKTV